MVPYLFICLLCGIQKVPEKPQSVKWYVNIKFKLKLNISTRVPGFSGIRDLELKAQINCECRSVIIKATAPRQRQTSAHVRARTLWHTLQLSLTGFTGYGYIHIYHIYIYMECVDAALEHQTDPHRRKAKSKWWGSADSVAAAHPTGVCTSCRVWFRQRDRCSPPAAD